MKVVTYEEWMEQNERLVKQQVALTKAQDSIGKDAYNIAVKEGFEGTEAEWLESIKGESAYQIAKRLGLTEAETEEEWINSLGGGGESGVGPAGKSAYEVYVDITDDDPVLTEPQWLESLQGEAGDSAYAIAVAEGFVGDKTAWLASLKGADGDQGEEGKSAYDIYVETTSDSPVKTEEQWLASLKGADGKSAYEYAEEEGYEGTEGEFAEALADVENKIDKSKIVTAWNSPKGDEVPSALLVYNSLDGGGSPGDSVIQLIKDAVDPVKGTGWTDENLVDHEERITALEGVYNINSWSDVQKIVRAGLARKYLSVGDQFLAEYNSAPTIFNVIGIDHPGLVPTDPRFTHTLALQPQDCLMMNAQFSAPQAIYGSTEELPAGTYIFTLKGVQYTFTSAESMPANGVLVGGGWTSYVPSTITIYGANRRDVVESGIAVTTTSGTDNLTPINNHVRCRYGSNEYAKSAMRQFLNSNEAVFNWEPQGLYDMPPSSYSGTGGFLYQLDPELVAVIGEVENKVALPTYDGGGQATVQDKAFLLSRVEVGLGSEGVTTGESVYEFYDGVTDAERIKLLSDSPRYWWLRSPYVGYTDTTRSVGPSGALSDYSANGADGLAPVCVIY